MRSCPVCARAADDLVPAERLLAGIGLVAVPAALAGAVLGKALAAGGTGHGATAGAATWLGGAVQAIGAQQVAAAVGAVVIAVGVAVPATGWTTPGQHRTTVSPAPSRTARPLAAGKVSLESADAGGRYVAVSGDFGILAQTGAASGAAARQRATLRTVAGIADPECFSFRGQDGRYLRHSSFRLRLNPDDGTVLFQRDATFCVRAGFTAGSIALESRNYPGFFVRHLGDELWIDRYDGSDGFRAQSSFLVRDPLA
nr:hypothetical protein GCM10020092_073700 [Actinoplanes digitatis]